jgi:hypothetical protein
VVLLARRASDTDRVGAHVGDKRTGHDAVVASATRARLWYRHPVRVRRVVHRTAADHDIIDPCVGVQSVGVQSVGVQSVGVQSVDALTVYAKSVDALCVHSTVVERGAVDSTGATGRRFR